MSQNPHRRFLPHPDSEPPDPSPYWPHHDFPLYPPDPDPPPSDPHIFTLHSDPLLQSPPSISIRVLDSDSDSNSITAVDLFDRENQVNFVMDLFEDRVERSTGRSGLVHQALSASGSRPIEDNFDPTPNPHHLDLELGFDRDDFFVHRRRRRRRGESSSLSDSDGGGLHVIGIGSDSDADNDDENHDIEADETVNICWENFHLEDHREDFEWEEVDGAVDEREILTMVLDAGEEAPLSRAIGEEEEEEEEESSDVDRVGGLTNLDWEVLLTVDNLDPNPGLENYFHGAADYEMLFGQFAENDNGLMTGRPPASRSVVESLPSVVLSEEDLRETNEILCAICKDGFGSSEEEEVKQLPCSHRYHGECIVPWLGIRNTCPVCRYELPTDDADYERWRARRDGRGV